MSDPVYVTAPLLDALLELARDRDPDPVSVPLSTRDSGDLEPNEGAGIPLEDVPPSTPIFAEFSFPGAGGAVNRVFGVDLGQPARSAQGRFVSHPDADPDLSSSDDLGPRVLVAIPPWESDDVRVYDRRGRRLPLRRVAAGAPAVHLEDDPSEG
ncbi:MAG: hypothetical protein ACQEQY_02480 [Halobacteriota archaeon]